MRSLLPLATGVLLCIAGGAALAVSSGPAVGTLHPEAAPSGSLYDLHAPLISGKDVALSAYRGQVALVVNTASKCGYTPQYEGLEQLYQTYRAKGLVVLGFPSNDFLGQEPGTNAEISKFCTTEFAVTFPMFAKIDVGGADTAPIYRFLLADAAATGRPGPVGWNFEKFLVSRQGRVIGRFKSAVKPDDAQLVKAVETALAAR